MHIFHLLQHSLWNVGEYIFISFSS
jgi:hypothetical protein